ncbi:unnamed protein product [Closterium sp. Naga37s-1]|nr:unnamed protein product [Closterium sp. Naga37s-1]
MVIEGWLEPDCVVVASAGSGRSPAVSGSVTASKKPPLPFAPKPPPSMLETPNPPEPAPPAAEPHPPTAAAPHAHALAGPAPVALVAPIAPVESPVPVVVVDAPPSAPVLDAPHVSVALPALVAAIGSSPHAVSATTGGAGPGEVGGGVALSAPVLPTAATSVPHPDVQAVPDPAPLAAAPLAQRHPSPGRRQHRPHSPAPRGRGGWWGGRGRGGGWAYDQPVTMADLQRVVSDAMRLERNGQASQSNSPRVALAHASLPPSAPYEPAPPLPQSAVPPPPAPSASAAAHGNRMHLPWVPPLAGMEFVTAAGGPVAAQYPSLLPVAPVPPAASVPVQSLAGPSPSAVVPEASLGQLWRLSEGLRAVHLIQVYGHAALSQGVHLDPGPRDECLDAADRLAELLAPVLAAPARGGVAGIGQLGTAVHGLRRFLRAGSAVDLIGATTVVVPELHRSLTGLLAVLDADQM